MTLTELGDITGPEHLNPVGLGTQPPRSGPSAAQISRWSTMITPFGPAALAGLATTPTKGGDAGYWTKAFEFVSTISTDLLVRSASAYFPIFGSTKLMSKEVRPPGT